MNRKLITLTCISLASFCAHAGVKVTSLGLKTVGENGYVNVGLEGRSRDLPDLKVSGRTIEITLSDAETFSPISKKINGAELIASVENGKVVVKATLPYEVEADGVDLGWKKKNIEVTFPRGKAKKVDALTTVESEKPVTPAVPAAPKKVENTVLAKVENAVPREKLDEDYLNNLMKEEVKKGEDAKALAAQAENKDSVSVQQAGIAKDAAAPANQSAVNENFSFAGYAAKFTVFLALVLGLFYGVVQLLKKGVFNRGKLGFLNNAQLIQVLSTTYVAPKRSLMIVKAHNQVFLVANSENGLQFLSEMTDTTGLLKEGEKFVTGTNFDLNLGSAEEAPGEPAFKLKENINESAPEPEEKGIAAMSAKDIVKFSDELKKKARKLKPIEFN